MSSPKPRHRSDGTFLSVVLVALALALGESAEASEQCILPPQEAGGSDASVLYQNSVRLKMLDVGKDPSMLDALSAEIGASYPELGSLIAGMSGDDGFVSPSIDRDAEEALQLQMQLDKNADVAPVQMHLARDPKPTVNVTRKGKRPLVVNVSNDDGNATDTTVVKDNDTDIKVARKVVKGDQKNHVVHSHVKTEKDQTKDEHTGNDSMNATANETEGEEQPFAKENITVRRHMLNITRRENSTHNYTQNVTVTETVRTVNVESSFHIISIYLVLFVPVIFAWWAYSHHGMQAYHYVWLLPLTMCAMSIGQDLVNQSLTMILEAPNAISAIQGFSMTVASACWIWFVDWEALKSLEVSKLSGWWGVAVYFAIYQMMNHWVYHTCTLSERTVITNLSPLVTLFAEQLAMPVTLKPGITFGGKMSLSLMALGAVLFALQNPTFTTKGISFAVVLLVATVPYRLAQRRFLGGGSVEVPLSLLACIDGFALGMPSVIFSAIRRIHLWEVMETSTETPVFIMLALSILTFVGLHVSGLAMLRLGSATTYLVFSNIAGLVTIVLGIYFFGDHAFATPLATIGLAANVGSGIWYSAEVQAQAKSDEKDGEVEY